VQCVESSVLPGDAQFVEIAAVLDDEIEAGALGGAQDRQFLGVEIECRLADRARRHEHHAEAVLSVRRQRSGARADAAHRRPHHARLRGEVTVAVGGQFPRYFEKTARLFVRPCANRKFGDHRRFGEISQMFEPALLAVEPVMDLTPEIEQFALIARRPGEVVVLLDPLGKPRPIGLGQCPPRALMDQRVAVETEFNLAHRSPPAKDACSFQKRSASSTPRARARPTAVRLREIGCLQRSLHNQRSPWPGLTRPSTSSWAWVISAAKPWMPGSSPGKGTYSCIMAHAARSCM
jgi:hypothetical protein